MAGSIIEIDGGLTRIKHVVTDKEVRTEDFLKKMYGEQPVDTGMLPMNCVDLVRYSNKGRKSTIFVIQIKPMMLAMNYRPRHASGDRNIAAIRYNLSIPWTLWFIQTMDAENFIGGVHLACCTDDVRKEGMKSIIYAAPLPNNHDGGNGAFCTGDVTVPPNYPQHRKIDTLMDDLLLHSTWNDDLRVDLKNLTGVVASYEEWQTKSADPDFWKQLKLRKHRNESVEGMLALLVQRNGGGS